MMDQLSQEMMRWMGLDPATQTVWVAIFAVAIRVAVVGAIILPVVNLIPSFCIWWERKVAGHIQGRLGPTHVGPYGLLQSIADGGKLLLKEDLIPEGADRFLFRLAPYLAFVPVFMAFLALPFGPQFVFEPALNIGVLYLLAVLAVEVVGVVLAGWSSGSKWSVYGAMREACQMVSYEIPLGLTIICGVLTAGTLNMVDLSYLQGRGLWGWFVFHNPFMFLAFILFFVTSLAACKRAPFDLPEAESELVGGYHTEYSGLRFAMFFLSEYAAMFAFAGIQTALFLGGWNSPLGQWDPIYYLVGYDPVVAGQAWSTGLLAGSHSVQAIAQAMGLSQAGLWGINLYCAAWFILKVLTLVFIQMWIRWTLPRIRIDQVMYACLKVLLPAGLLALVGNAVWLALVPQATMDQPLSGHVLAYWEHLLGVTPTIQLTTQFLLMACGLLIALSALAVILHAFFTRDTHPPRSMFTDIMPVGNQVAFTTSKNKPIDG